jgi:hypothetical protein
LHQLKRPPRLHRSGVSGWRFEELDYLIWAKVFRAGELLAEDFDRPFHVFLRETTPPSGG